MAPPAVHAEVDDTAVRLMTETRVLGGRAPVVRLVGVVHVGEPAYYGAVRSLLGSCAVVLHEGLAVDESRPPPDDRDVAGALPSLGLVFQRDALVQDARWDRADLSVAEVRAALEARTDTTPAQVDEWLVDRDRTELREALARSLEGERVRQLARLSFVRGLLQPPPDDPGWRDVVIGGRDAHVVARVESETEGPVCVVYGAAHLPDLTARLVRRGWTVDEVGALSVVTVPLAELGLGPVQVRQVLAR